MSDTCGICGGELQEVRPGKHQCNFCECTDWNEWRCRWMRAQEHVRHLEAVTHGLIASSEWLLRDRGFVLESSEEAVAFYRALYRLLSLGLTLAQAVDAYVAVMEDIHE